MWKSIEHIPIGVYCKVFVPMERSKSGGVIVNNVKKDKKGRFIGLDYYANEKPPQYFWDDGA